MPVCVCVWKRGSRVSICGCDCCCLVCHICYLRLLAVSVSDDDDDTSGGEKAGRCLVLEYCAGGSLDSRLGRDRALLERQQLHNGAEAAASLASSAVATDDIVAVLSWVQRLEVAVAVTRAIVHLHSLGIYSVVGASH